MDTSFEVQTPSDVHTETSWPRHVPSQHSARALSGSTRAPTGSTRAPTDGRAMTDRALTDRALTGASMGPAGTPYSRTSLMSSSRRAMTPADVAGWIAPASTPALDLYANDPQAIGNIQYDSLTEIYPMICLCAPGSNIPPCFFARDGHNGSLPRKRKVLWAWPFFSWFGLKFAKLGWMKTLYTDKKGASLGVIAFSLVASVLVDAFTDPAMSNFTDQFRSKYGRRRPFVLFSALYTPLVLICSFAPPGSGVVASIWFAIFHIAFKLADTVFVLAADAWGTELTPNYAERSNLWAWKYFFTPAGILFGMVALGRTYPVDLYILPIIGLSALHFQGCISLAYYGKEQDMSRLLSPPKATKGGLWSDRFTVGDVIPSLMCTMMNPPFRTLLWAAMAKGFGADVPFAILPYVTRWIIGDKCPSAGADDLFVYCVILNTIASLVVIPAWLWLAGKTSKYFAYCFHMGFLALSSVAFIFVDLDTGDCTMSYLAMALSFVWGVALCGQFILTGLVNDIIDYDEFLGGGYRREACYVMSAEFLPKFAAIPGEFIPLMLMAYNGYRRPLPKDPGPPSCSGGIGQDEFCAAFYRNVAAPDSCSDEMSCAEYLADGAKAVCHASVQQCGIVQNEGVRWVLRVSFALVPFFFLALAFLALLGYPKAARSETQHQQLVQSISRLKRGETVEDPWNPGVYVSPAKPDGPRAGALAYFWPSELRAALAASPCSRDDDGHASVKTLLNRPLRLALLAAALIPIGVTIIAWGWVDMFDDLGASVSPIGLVLLGCGLLGVWFHGVRASAALALRKCQVQRSEICDAYRKAQQLAGGKADLVLREEDLPGSEPAASVLGAPAGALGASATGQL